MKCWIKTAAAAATGILLPALARPQSTLAGDIKGLQSTLDTLYSQSLPQFSMLIGVGRGIAGFAAIWYIASRVWRHIAHAEQVDVFPLFRPFVLGSCILLWPSVVGLINGVMQPAVDTTAQVVQNNNDAVNALLAQKQAAIQNTNQYQWYVGPNGSGNEDLWEQYSGDASTGTFSGITNSFKFAMAKAGYNFRNYVKQFMAEVLEVLYEAAALCINTIRTFNLIVMAILGPLAFGIAVFDGFHHTLNHWLARYLNVFLWLPVANVFGAIIGNIQVQMLKIDITQIQSSGDTSFNATDAGYMVFMVIAIIGYLTVPSVAGYIVNVGGHPHTAKVNNTVVSTVNNTAGAAGGMAGQVAGTLAGKAEQVFRGGGSQGSTGGPGGGNNYMANKIEGK